jgi:hypothetical protein
LLAKIAGVCPLAAALNPALGVQVLGMQIPVLPVQSLQNVSSCGMQTFPGPHWASDVQSTQSSTPSKSLQTFTPLIEVAHEQPSLHV